ncbi:MAG: large subunit ribosomal protein L10 [Pirellulaceae bacterium]|jgi:large subunit ribosomal protein L10
MSKYLKDLISQDLSKRLAGVEDMLLVNVIGIDANSTVALRKRLREKNISLLVIKNSLAKRATEGTPLANAFEGCVGTNAIIWGCEDLISLAKEVVELDKDKTLQHFEPRGGVMDGEHLTAARVREISQWPNREEQLSILSGMLTSPWQQLSSQLISPAGKLASQIEKKAEGE